MSNAVAQSQQQSPLNPEPDRRVLSRGEIYYVDLEGVEHASRYIQRKNRPALIIQNNVGNAHAETVIVAPLSRQIKKHYPFQYRVSVGGSLSVVLFEQIMTLDKFRVMNYITKLSGQQMAEAEKALMHSLGLSPLNFENVTGFCVDSKLTRERREESRTSFLLRFHRTHGPDIEREISLESLQKFDASLGPKSNLDEVYESLNCCEGLHAAFLSPELPSSSKETVQ